MSAIAQAATVTAPCDQCGRRFTPRPEQLLTGGGLYCKTACRVKAAEIRVALRQGRVCAACGGPRGRIRHFGLEICTRCRTVAWQTCWRKQPHLADPGETLHLADGRLMRSYACPLCPHWHLTSMPSCTPPPDDFLERQRLLALLITATGFDIDTHRNREIGHG